MVNRIRDTGDFTESDDKELAGIITAFIPESGLKMKVWEIKINNNYQFFKENAEKYFLNRFIEFNKSIFFKYIKKKKSSFL